MPELKLFVCQYYEVVPKIKVVASSLRADDFLGLAFCVLTFCFLLLGICAAAVGQARLTSGGQVTEQQAERIKAAVPE